MGSPSLEQRCLSFISDLIKDLFLIVSLDLFLTLVLFIALL